MFCKVNTMSLNGINALPVNAEADLSSGGLPVFEMVGFLGGEVKESRERIRTALKNSGYLLPPKRITVNLSPADIRKNGSAFDLPVALSLLCTMGVTDPEAFRDTVIVGELSLSGGVNGVNGILPMVIQARNSGNKRFILPSCNLAEGSAVDGIDVIGVSSLTEAIGYLNGTIQINPERCNIQDMLHKNSVYPCDLSDIAGQENVKRSIEVAVSGMHNILIIGPPGSGKSMIAKCIPSILPELDIEECLEISQIYSVAGMLGPEGLITRRPFISPHHTVTAQALSGGGSIPRPGCVSLAHRGVLFLDELPEFSRGTLETLRQPMEDRQVTISRAHSSCSFPTDFLLACAMNPCKCGYYPDRMRCRCTENQVRSYLSRISQPLLDRIDICTESEEIKYSTLSSPAGKAESSETVRGRVSEAVEIQKRRFSGTPLKFNSDIGVKELRRYCELGLKEERLLEKAFKNLGLSARAYHRILRCARTIADLAHSDRINCTHISEAVSYRKLDRRYWNALAI